VEPPENLSDDSEGSVDDDDNYRDNDYAIERKVEARRREQEARELYRQDEMDRRWRDHHAELDRQAQAQVSFLGCDNAPRWEGRCSCSVTPPKPWLRS